jgi:hypothetical protein
VGAIVATIVGQDASDPDAVSSIPGQGSLEELSGGWPQLVWKHFDVDQPGCVVDAHVNVFPAGAPDDLGAVPMDAVADVPCNSSQFLHVQVQQVARSLPFVPVGRFGRIQQAHAVQASALQDTSDGRRRHSKGPSDLRTCLSGPTKLKDYRLELVRSTSWAAMGSRRSISQTRRTFQPIAGQPLVDGPLADAELCGGLLDRPFSPQDSIDQNGSTDRGSSGQTVNVHPGFLSWELTVSSPSASPKRPRMNNQDLQ